MTLTTVGYHKQPHPFGWRLIRLAKVLVRPGNMLASMSEIKVEPPPRVHPLFKLQLNGDKLHLSGLYIVQRQLRNIRELKKYFLRTIVFPTHLKFQKHKVSASGADLGGNILFRKRLGFTGTPSELLPMSLGKCGFAEGTEGEMIYTLTSERFMKPALVRSRDWTTKMLLDMIAEGHEMFDQPLHALIDTGALIVGMSNAEVAAYLLDRGLPLDGVVYLGDNARERS